MAICIKNSKNVVPELGQVIFIGGTQWGDEGKGKLVDILSGQYDIIARAAGGANAGHTIYITDEKGETKKFIFHLLPSGVLREDKICIIGNGTVIHIPTLLDEIHGLKEKGIDIRDHLFISDRAHVIFDFHKDIDGVQEEWKGDKKVGTTKRGIGPTYADKISRTGMRIIDLFDFEHFAEKLRENVTRHEKTYGIKVNFEGQINLYKDAVGLIEPMIINTTEYIDNAYKAGKTILIEGAQGTHLDIDFGTYPYVTSSNTTIGGACTGLGIAPNKLNTPIGIVKTYATRVGEGPFPTELNNFEGEMLREQGGEYGSTTGRTRRCGWLDAIAVKNSIIINGITSINFTKLDVLSGFKTIKVGIKYKLNGEYINFIPASLKDFENVEVEYIEFPGWEEDISKMKNFDDLPENAKNYVNSIEEILETPINFIGVGMDRNDMIYK